MPVVDRPTKRAGCCRRVAGVLQAHMPVEESGTKKAKGVRPTKIARSVRTSKK
jgi:hypothetical protein